MSSIGSPSPFFFGGATSYEIERSLRFVVEDGSKLTRTFGTNTSNTTKTISFWMKRGKIGASQIQNLFCTALSGYIEGRLRINTDDTLQLEERDAGNGTSDGRRTTTQKFRDIASWYHIVLALDSTQGTEIDRAKIYVNGSQVTDFSATRTISQNYSFSLFRSSAENYIGDGTGTGDHFDGYLAEINFIDGQALTPASFGKTSTTTGQWIPKKYTGTYGNNGFYLKFNDNTNNAALGADSSGNGNNWTPSNIASSHDTLSDTPTNNFCVLNPLNKTNDADLREGNLKFFQSSNDESATATFGITSGKWYWEVYKNSSQNPELGIEPLTEFLSNKTDVHSNTKVNFRTNGGDQRVGTSSPTSLTGSSGGQTGAGVIAIAVDFDNKKIWYTDTSGNFFNSGNPATGSNAAFTFSNVAVANGCVPHFFCGTGSNNSFNVNFGQDGTFGGNTSAGGYADGNGHGNFKYSVPSGYLALCSANLSDPTIKKPTDYFDTLLYTGQNTSSLYNVTGLDFQPDWVWGKARNDSIPNILFDAVRGEDKQLETDSFSAEVVRSSAAYRFLSNGFAVSTVGNLNNPVNYVAWNWNAGGSTVTNNDGTISSQVRASTTAGFSIVGYTGNGSNSQTVGHGLGVTPDVVILKDRDTNGITGRWTVLHSFDTSKNIELNTTGAAFGHQGRGSVTGVSNSTFTLFGSTDTQTVNESGDNYIAYVFSEVAGYSKFGSYSSNGNSNGTFVFLGFKPALVIFKNTTSTEAWSMFDNKRDPHNPVAKFLRPSGNNTETSGSNDIDFLSNGFKARTSNNPNVSSNTYIYLAFAEASFKFANAR